MEKVSMPPLTCSTYSPIRSRPMPAAYSTTSAGAVVSGGSVFLSRPASND
jgi:hypothetical protein